jgi:hypothetical protein
MQSNLCGGAGFGDCDSQLRSLYSAYLELIAGKNVVVVQSADFRKMEYGQGNIEELKRHYNALWDTCGMSSGMPRLGPTRGRPVYLGC